MMSDGWKIYAHKGKIPKAEREAQWCNIKTRFKAENVDFSDNNYKFAARVGLYHFDIIVSFPDKNEYGYGIEYTSEMLGYKPDEKKAHRTLYNAVMAKIRGKKQGFWSEDGIESPMPRTRLLRMRHRHNWHKCSVRLYENILKNRAVPLCR